MKETLTMGRNTANLLWAFISHIIFSFWLFVLLVIRHFSFTQIIFDNIIFSIVIVTLLSLLSSIMGVGKKVFDIAFSYKYIWILIMITLVIWVQFGVEWLSHINPINYESFMRYEPFAAIFSLPIGLLVFIVFEIIPGPENKYIYASLLILLYLISFYLQLYFVARFLSKRRK